MKSSIFVPKTIKVGFQNRSDTYTKKLAYVVYIDEKGNTRKEKSWNSWRDDKINPEEFDNTPTSGFVLNKKVGDYSDGWNHRKSYIRVYDPRGFEFEIDVTNLLYILENTSSIKGKGLEGEFVYGWDGKELVLLPVYSPEYKDIKEYNKIVFNNEYIKAKDLVVGATYVDKNNVEYIYMGKFDYYGSGYEYTTKSGETKRVGKSSEIGNDCITKTINGWWSNRTTPDYKCVQNFNHGKHFWFAKKYIPYFWEKDNCKEWVFESLKGVTKKFIGCIDNKCCDNYADLYELMLCNSCFSPIDDNNTKYSKMDFETFSKKVADHGNRRFTSLTDKKEYEVRRKFGNDAEFGYIYNLCNSKESENRKTLEEVYEEINPCWVERYLVNGKFNKREEF